MISTAHDEGDVGLIGLAVMGQNLALNLADHGNRVVVYNRTTSVMRNFVGEHPDQVGGTSELSDLVGSLSTPRKLILMVKAGEAVDQTLEALHPLLSSGDIVIDGGNSFWKDTERRVNRAAEKGVRLLGVGISGGEEGARYGPSIMPGGNQDAWPEVREMLTAIAAKAPDGNPCCDWVGPGGAGHFVKMVHNGIEYGDMQVIAEAYHLMRSMRMTNDDMAAVFERFSKGKLDSYLISITAEILQKKDKDGSPLIDKILDSAGQKGTGKWTVDAALDLGQPITLIAEAVFARIVSALKAQRVAAAKLLPGPNGSPGVTEEDIEDALYGSKIVSYAQGFMLLKAASAENDWRIDLARIAPLWRAGCIIRATILDHMTNAFRTEPELDNLMLDPYFAGELGAVQNGWRRTAAAAVAAGIPVPAYSSALSFYDSYRAERLPANLIQAQRDYFGAHTYERVDRPEGAFFHTDW